MQHERLARAIHRVQVRQHRMQPERAVEVERAVLRARIGQRQRAAQLRIRGLGVRRHGREAVEAAAQDDEHEPAVGISGGLQMRERREQR
jgi:hypothetical protein